MNYHGSRTSGIGYAQGVAWNEQQRARMPQSPAVSYNPYGVTPAQVMAVGGTTWGVGELAYQYQRGLGSPAERLSSRLLSNFGRGAGAIGRYSMEGGQIIGGTVGRIAGRWIQRGYHRYLSLGRLPDEGVAKSQLFRFRTPSQHMMMVPHHIGSWFLPESISNMLIPKSMRKAVAKSGKSIGKKLFGNTVAPLIAGGIIAHKYFSEAVPLSVAASSYATEAAGWGVGFGLGGAAGSAVAGSLGLTGSIAGVAIAGAAAVGGGVVVSALAAHHMEKLVAATKKRMGSYHGYAFMNKQNVYAGGQQTYTMRQQSLMALHRSPMNDRGRLLGNEASICHL